MKTVLRGTVLLSLLAIQSAAAASTPSPIGTWYFHARGAPYTVVITRGPLPNSLAGTCIFAGETQSLGGFAWDAARGRLEFFRQGIGFRSWYRGTVVEGVLKGRYAETPPNSPRPGSERDYRFQFTAWNATALEANNSALVFELLLDGESRARLRLDRATRGRGFVGRFKIYSTVRRRADGEQAEEEVEISKWDGQQIVFLRRVDAAVQTFRGAVRGNEISGTYTASDDTAVRSWSGTRADVLTYGLHPKTPKARADWQERTRLRLRHLLMSTHSAPLSARVSELEADLPPLRSRSFPPERDDDPEAWPRDYRLTELQFDFELANPYGGPVIKRRVHGYRSIPINAAPGEKLPAILMINGHGGSGLRMLDPEDALYWYGESFARRGFVVLSLDFSHRPREDRFRPDGSVLYEGPRDGDDVANGNGLHPAIKAEGFGSDWEEDGERVWDAMRGIDYLLSLPQVDATRVGVTGLSMGGTLAALTAALDPRVTFAIPVAPASDFGVMLYKGNHSCWLWMHGDIREYFDASDLLALIAPRPLLVITGKTDGTYSRFQPPFASDKQVLRRARVAYAGDESHLVHYLHSGGHRFRVGDRNPSREVETGVRTPVLTEPANAKDQKWQIDSQTVLRAATIFDLLKEWTKPK